MPVAPSQPAASTQQASHKNLNEADELNKLKFIPHVIHIERSILPRNSAFKLWDLLLYQQSLKQEEQFELIIEDCFYESQ